MPPRKPPTPAEMSDFLHKKFPQLAEGLGVNLNEVRQRIQFDLRTTRARAADWTFELCENEEFVLISTSVYGTPYHRLERNTEVCPQWMWASLSFSSEIYSALHIDAEGRFSDDTLPKGSVERDWLFTKTAWEGLIVKAKQAVIDASKRFWEGKRQLEKSVHETHGDAAELLQGLIARAGITDEECWKTARVGVSEARDEDGHRMELILFGDSIDKIAAVLRELGVEPVSEGLHW